MRLGHFDGRLDVVVEWLDGLNKAVFVPFTELCVLSEGYRSQGLLLGFLTFLAAGMDTD